MIPGSSVQDANPACRPQADDDASRSDATTGYDSHQSRITGHSRHPHGPLQDIEDIIDKLTAVTQQLRRPHSKGEAQA
jgi:hypothetical protein